MVNIRILYRVSSNFKKNKFEILFLLKKVILACYFLKSRTCAVPHYRHSIRCQKRWFRFQKNKLVNFVLLFQFSKTAWSLTANAFLLACYKAINYTTVLRSVIHQARKGGVCRKWIGASGTVKFFVKTSFHFLISLNLISLELYNYV